MTAADGTVVDAGAPVVRIESRRPNSRSPHPPRAAGGRGAGVRHRGAGGHHDRVDPSVTAAFSPHGSRCAGHRFRERAGPRSRLHWSDAGATVVGADIGVPAEESGSLSPAGHVRVRLDLCDRNAVAAGVGRAIEALGGIDVCVNCAGIGGAARPPTTPTTCGIGCWRRTSPGSFAVAKLVGAHMIGRGGGSIVNIASVGGLVGYAGSVGYQASKGAIVQMTRTLAVEWGPSNVRVNAIAPGHIATELVQRQWQVEPELTRVLPVAHTARPARRPRRRRQRRGLPRIRRRSHDHRTGARGRRRLHQPLTLAPEGDHRDQLTDRPSGRSSCSDRCRRSARSSRGSRRCSPGRAARLRPLVSGQEAVAAGVRHLSRATSSRPPIAATGTRSRRASS